MSIFDDLLRMARETGADTFHSRKEVPGGWEETIMIGIPEFRSNLTQDKTSEGKQVNPLLTKLLPPREQFKTNLMLLMDVAKATKNERSVVERLIKRFDGDKQSKTVSQRTTQK